MFLSCFFRTCVILDTSCAIFYLWQTAFTAFKKYKKVKLGSKMEGDTESWTIQGSKNKEIELVS